MIGFADDPVEERKYHDQQVAKIVDALWKDLDDRAGFSLDPIDSNTRTRMKKDWTKIINHHLWGDSL